MEQPRVKGRGRPQEKPVTDDSGNPIDGLAATPYKRDKKDPTKVLTYRYYAVGTKPIRWFGTDKVLAIARFKAWKSQQIGEYETIQVENPIRIASAVGNEPTITPTLIRDILENRECWEYIIPLDVFWKRVGELISQDPKNAAHRSGVPGLADVHIVKPKLPLSLSEIGELSYGIVEQVGEAKKTKFVFNGGKAVSHSQKTRLLKAWSEFENAVKPITKISDVDVEAVEKYGQFLQSADLDDKTLRTRIDNVQSILKYARARRENHIVDIDKVKLRITSQITKPPEPDPDPDPILRDDFAALLKAADTKWKAVFLTALNLALHPKELADVYRSEIDLEQGTFATNRKKLGKKRRCAKLWPRTINAIQTYQSENPHDSKYLFVNEEDNQLNSHSIGDNLGRIVEKSNIGKPIHFDSLRDGARTNMSGEGAAIVMGHSLGTADKYKLRTPTDPLVVAACQSVEAHFFPSPPQEKIAAKS